MARELAGRLSCAHSSILPFSPAKSRMPGQPSSAAAGDRLSDVMRAPRSLPIEVADHDHSGKGTHVNYGGSLVSSSAFSTDVPSPRQGHSSGVARQASTLDGRFQVSTARRRPAGTPDLVLSKYRLAVFVHGCFWHQHGCKKSKRPASNREFWNAKFDANISRDARNRTRLEDRGWTVATIWECRLESDTESLLTLLRKLRSSTPGRIDDLPDR